MGNKPDATFAGVPGLQQPSSFDFADPSTWSTWIEQFEDYAYATGLHQATDEVRVRTLLYCMGVQARRVLVPFNLSAEEVQSYSVVKSKFTSHFVNPLNEVHESYRFHKRKQQGDESADAFYSALRDMVKRCNSIKQVRRPEPSSGRQARKPSKERRLKSKYRWFEPEEEEQGYTPKGSIPFDQENFPEVHRQETGRGPEKCKLKSATPQHPQSRETIGQPQMAAPSLAQVAAPTAEHQTNHKPVADQKLIEENRSLKASLAELKKEMAALKQTIQDLANKTKQASTTPCY
ncbi:hypothetical protein HPB49_005822 [Dermacentor silvarum]|uniref:Uncharacterized protein n=1 Tax=Dermacentor silvarum TaxID=543639 RepID=A0ACB8CDN3_DERSI|nr:hypothetical protein HPB49_005822 [Dermacentor silvarum]